MCPLLEDAEAGGVKFRRAIADKKLKITDRVETVVKMQALLRRASRSSRTAVEDISNEIVPFAPSLDFSDARNSGLIALIL
jgi:hypothetical protein